MPLLEACLEGETSIEASSSDCTWSGVYMWSPDIIKVSKDARGADSTRKQVCRLDGLFYPLISLIKSLDKFRQFSGFVRFEDQWESKQTSILVF